MIAYIERERDTIYVHWRKIIHLFARALYLERDSKADL